MPFLPPSRKAAIYFQAAVPLGWIGIVRRIQWTVFPVPSDAANGPDPSSGPYFNAWINQSAPVGYASLVAQNGAVANLSGMAVGYLGTIDDLEIIVPQGFSFGVALLLTNWPAANASLVPNFRIQGWLVPYTGRPDGFELANECGTCGTATPFSVSSPAPAPAPVSAPAPVAAPAAPAPPAIRQGDVIGLCRSVIGNAGGPTDPQGKRNQVCMTTGWAWERQGVAWPDIVARVRAGGF